jgi:hypothetical protein
MIKLFKSYIRNLFFELLEKQAYQYLYGPDIAPDRETLERIQ